MFLIISDKRMRIELKTASYYYVSVIVYELFNN